MKKMHSETMTVEVFDEVGGEKREEERRSTGEERKTKGRRKNRGDERRRGKEIFDGNLQPN